MFTPVDVALAGPYTSKDIFVVDRTTKPHLINFRRTDGTSYKGLIYENKPLIHSGLMSSATQLTGFSYYPAEAKLDMGREILLGNHDRKESGGK